MGRRRAATLVLVAWLLCGCAMHVRRYPCTSVADGPAVDFAESWACNRKVMLRIAKGGKFSLDEFRQASRFFEEITSIPADSLPTTLGPVPGGGLKESIRRWDEWCRENCDRFPADPDTPGTAGPADEARPNR